MPVNPDDPNAALLDPTSTGSGAVQPNPDDPNSQLPQEIVVTGKRTPAAPPAGYHPTLGGVVSGFFSNIIPDAIQGAKQLGSAITHPIQTAQALGNLGEGFAQEAVDVPHNLGMIVTGGQSDPIPKQAGWTQFASPQARTAIQNANQSFQDKYIPQRPGESWLDPISYSLQNHPGGVVGDAMMFVPGGAVAGAAQGVKAALVGGKIAKAGEAAATAAKVADVAPEAADAGSAADAAQAAAPPSTPPIEPGPHTLSPSGKPVIDPDVAAQGGSPVDMINRQAAKNQASLLEENPAKLGPTDIEAATLRQYEYEQGLHADTSKPNPRMYQIQADRNAAANAQRGFQQWPPEGAQAAQEPVATPEPAPASEAPPSPTPALGPTPVYRSKAAPFAPPEPALPGSAPTLSTLDAIRQQIRNGYEFQKTGETPTGFERNFDPSIRPPDKNFISTGVKYGVPAALVGGGAAFGLHLPPLLDAGLGLGSDLLFGDKLSKILVTPGGISSAAHGVGRVGGAVEPALTATTKVAGKTAVGGYKLGVNGTSAANVLDNAEINAQQYRKLHPEQ